jgi:N-glycosylase/DNA lyase
MTAELRVLVEFRCSVGGIEKLIDRQFKTIRQLQKSISEVKGKPLIMKRYELKVEQFTSDAQVLTHNEPNSEVLG